MLFRTSPEDDDHYGRDLEVSASLSCEYTCDKVVSPGSPCTSYT